jgi:hypothetical protein
MIGQRRPAGAGVWLVAMVALLLAPHLAPANGTAGRSRPPTYARRHAATAPSGRALAANPRITTTTAHGCDPRPDLRSPRLDARVARLLTSVTAHGWRVRVSCVHSGHSKYVHGTRRVSNHFVWRAVDLDMVDGRPVSPGNGRARALARWLGTLRGELRPSEVGSPWLFGPGPWFSDDGHQGHIHVGFSGGR